MELIIEGLPRSNKEVEKEATWNLLKPGGWEDYKTLTKEAEEKIKEVAEDEELDANETMKKVEAIEDKIKFKAFGKTKPETKKKRASKMTINAEDLLVSQTKRLEEEVLRIEKEGQGRVGKIYKMKKFITGESNKGQEPVAVRNPVNNELIVEPEEIKRVTLQYCQDNLEKKKKSDEYSKEEKVKKELHEIRMSNKEEDGFEVDEDNFEAIIQKFKGKQTKVYDFITKSAKEYIKSLFWICRKFIKQEEFPDKFGETVLHMIWKKKGPAETLKNNRFIHMKHPMARACEALVFSKCKEDILEKSTVYQIGGQAGHAPEEHIFTLKSLIGLMFSTGEGLILNLVDIISFFDREDILDVVEAMEDMGVNKKAIRLWYKLNEKTEITVKTSVGKSKKAMVGALVGQGSGGAAVGLQAM